MEEPVEKNSDDFIISLNSECPKELGELLESSSEDNRRFDDAGFTLALQNGLENLRLENSLTDVALCIGNKVFPCHRVVLAAASNYFRAMFCNELKEKYEEEIVIQGVEADTMEIILNYTYTSKIVITKQNVQKILEAASLFQDKFEKQHMHTGSTASDISDIGTHPQPTGAAYVRLGLAVKGP
ncbi:kelch 6 [Pelobates cultripes]|uniref:Kelch 6 n=1 Tax=Pelobates cultripes TaxID=61616 RepID=A0AAD1RAF2_PELCU|nr:kelch 6 [Pelobates cultripes]